ncbi:MAG: AhpC/TSA family protein [Muribaculaceae bacterium]|nr:AhpC/TSA family protein [Muribaculaceae bacterium]
MHSKLLILATGALLAACGAKASPETFTLVASVPEDLNGETAFLVNYDTGAKTDSVTVENGTVTFHGTADKRYPARLIVNGSPMGTFYIDGGNITLDGRKASGSPFNDMEAALASRAQQFYNQFNATAPDSTGDAARQSIQDAYKAFTDSVFNANKDNAIGYTRFLEMAYDMTLPELQAALEANPAMKESQRVSKLITAAENKAATQPGNKFKDFTIEGDSITEKLSDYVGKGKPVLVDFWASWCGPCVRQLPVLKSLLKEYGQQGLEVLGVAVWDEPENTLKAIKSHDLPWHTIMNAQAIPTDLYGISGIPCIILFGPDGTIISRDKQGDELRADVAAYFNPAPADSTRTN